MKASKQLLASALLLGSVFVPSAYGSTTGSDPRPSTSVDGSRKPFSFAPELSLICLLATGALLSNTLVGRRRY